MIFDPTQAITLAVWHRDPRNDDAVLVYTAPDGRHYRLCTVRAIAWRKVPGALEFQRAELLRRARGADRDNGE